MQIFRTQSTLFLNMHIIFLARHWHHRRLFFFFEAVSKFLRCCQMEGLPSSFSTKPFVGGLFDAILDADYAEEGFLCIVDCPHTDRLIKDYYKKHQDSPDEMKFFIAVAQLQQARNSRLAATTLQGAGASGCAPHVSAHTPSAEGFPSSQKLRRRSSFVIHREPISGDVRRK